MSYPMLDVFLSMLWFFLWILWIFLVIRIIMDIFASEEMSGWAKALWVVLVIILPLFGVLLYLIVRGSGMRARQEREMQARDEAFRSYVQDAAGTSSATELSKLADLHQRGVLSDREFELGKDKLLH